MLKNITAILLTLFFSSYSVANEVSYEIGPDSNNSSEEWRYLIAFPVVWATAINGEIESDGERIALDVPFSDIFKKPKFCFNW